MLINGLRHGPLDFVTVNRLFVIFPLYIGFPRAHGVEFIHLNLSSIIMPIHIIRQSSSTPPCLINWLIIMLPKLIITAPQDWLCSVHFLYPSPLPQSPSPDTWPNVTLVPRISNIRFNRSFSKQLLYLLSVFFEAIKYINRQMLVREEFCCSLPRTN